MERTREKILAILRADREVTVDDLTHALGLASATVRRHLDILQRDGYVGVRPVRRETGRPHYVFTLTHAAAEAPRHFVRLGARLLDEVVALRPQDTSGLDGAAVTSLLFERLAHAVERSCAPKVNAATLARRVDQAVAALADEGYDFEVIARDGAFLLAGRDCPCRRIAGRDPDACRYDERLLTRLLAARVVRSQPVDGVEGCVYAVVPRSSGATS